MDPRTLPDGRFVRVAAKTRSWEKAEIQAARRKMSPTPNKPSAKERIRLEDAIEYFREDEKSRHLSKDSQRKSVFFFEKQLKTWAERQGLVFLDQLRPPELTKFRAQWGNGSATTRRKHERLVAFFWFCIRMDWLDKNPALLLKRVKIESMPTDYFTKKEFEALVDATYAYGNWLGGHDYEHRRDRVRALILQGDRKALCAICEGPPGATHRIGSKSLGHQGAKACAREDAKQSRVSGGGLSVLCGLVVARLSCDPQFSMHPQHHHFWDAQRGIGTLEPFLLAGP
jgi:hypothetical protein